MFKCGVQVLKNAQTRTKMHSRHKIRENRLSCQNKWGLYHYYTQEYIVFSIHWYTAIPYLSEAAQTLVRFV